MSSIAHVVQEATYGDEFRFACPSCGTGGMLPFYRVERAPVHSVLLMPTREFAIQFPRRDIQLAICAACGFISNATFDATLHRYSSDYEETQGYSATFRDFHRNLAISLIDTFNLRDKRIIEIGCGKGEFLALLAELGGNRGIGFDPAFVADRNPVKHGQDVQFITDFYSANYADLKADFICCKMTLEHIWNTNEFVSTVRRAIGARRDCIVFFQVPDMTRVLRDLAFWDIYYEHCSYFTAGSLRQLFERCGFKVLRTNTEYDDQYLTITAEPTEITPSEIQASKSDIQSLVEEARRFSRACEDTVSEWRARLQRYARERKKIVIWGSGSKAVAFLTALDSAARIDYVVDINPNRHQKFMAGTGQEIVAPEFLKSYQPDIAIAMNTIYKHEIQDDLDRMKLETELLTL